MSSRTGNWMIALGVLVALAGLCTAPAGLGTHADTSLLGFGSAMFGMGALAAAGGLYLKSLVLSSAAPHLESHVATSNSGKKPRGACDLCHKETPVVHCKVHQFHLCPACLAEHYDFRACVYVPSTRRTESRSGKSISAKAHA
jgi:hypothetical protein